MSTRLMLTSALAATIMSGCTGQQESKPQPTYATVSVYNHLNYGVNLDFIDKSGKEQRRPLDAVANRSSKNTTTLEVMLGENKRALLVIDAAWGTALCEEIKAEPGETKSINITADHNGKVQCSSASNGI